MNQTEFHNLPDCLSHVRHLFVNLKSQSRNSYSQSGGLKLIAQLDDLFYCSLGIGVDHLDHLDFTTQITEKYSTAMCYLIPCLNLMVNIQYTFYYFSANKKYPLFGILYCDLNLVMDFVHQFCSGNTLFMQA